MADETTKDDVQVDVPGTGEEHAARVESLQEVVDRVRSYQEGAPVATVRAELESAFAKAGLPAPDGLDDLARSISDTHRVEVHDGDVEG